MAGGVELGVDLSAENGGVPERGILLINATTCPAPLVLVPNNDPGAWQPHCLPVCSGRRVTARGRSARFCAVAMRRRDLVAASIGALAAVTVTVLLAQMQSWTAPRTWATGDLLTADQFNIQFSDNLLNLRASAACADTGITGTASSTTVLYGNCRWDEVGTDTVVSLSLPGPADQSATVGTAFSLTLLAATGGTTPYTYVATNIPTGLAFNATTRVLSGTPTTAQMRDGHVSSDRRRWGYGVGHLRYHRVCCGAAVGAS